MGIPLDQHLDVTNVAPALSAKQMQALGKQTLAEASVSGATSPISLTTIDFNTESNGMPILNSLPSAPSAIYMDFDGGVAWGTETHTPYDTNGNASVFDTNEQAVIAESWRHMSMYFAMFNVNVTTIDPGPSVPKAWILITNSYGGGVNSVGSFPDPSPQGLAASSFARNRVSGIAHEVGHDFGNWHTSRYDNDGNKTAEYHGAFDPLHGAIMGIDYGGIIHKWTTWHDSIDAINLQDDIGIIQADLDAADGGASDGFRVDDDPDGSLSTPRSLTNVGVSKVATGIIERPDDVDVFSFTVPSTGNYTISVVRDMPSGVDLKVEMYNSSNSLISSEDYDPKAAVEDGSNEIMANDHYQSWRMSSGQTIKIKVMGHGNYGDVGQYIVRVDPLLNGSNPSGSGPVRWQNDNIGITQIPGFASYDSGTGTLTMAGSGKEIWDEYDILHYMYQPLQGDGSITARVTGITDTSSWAQAGVMIRESLVQSSKQASMVMTPDHGAEFVWRDTTNGDSDYDNTGSASFTPTWVRLSRSGNVFTAEYSANGSSWSALGSPVTISMGTNVFIGLAVASNNQNALNVATFSDIQITNGIVNPQPTTNGLSNPTLSTGTTTPSSIALSWTNVSGETGYSIERSEDGINFPEVATVGVNVTSFTDTGLREGQRYWYRVRAKGSGTTVSTGSNYVHAVTKAGAVTEPNIISYSNNTLIIDWKDASGEDSYQIQRSPNGTSSWTTVGTVNRNVPSFNNSGLSANTRYYYRIRTVQGGVVTATSSVVNDWTKLNAPSGLTFTTKSSSQMAISWSAVSGATSYQVERSLDGSDWDVVSASQAGTTYTDNDVSPMGEYYYRVTANNSNTKGMPSMVFAASPANSTGLPGSWITQDIGSVGGTGASTYDGNTDTDTIIGSGADVWDTADQFRYVAHQMNGTAYAQVKVVSWENTDYYSKTGIMVRDGTAAGAKNVFIEFTGGGEAFFQWRSSTNGFSDAIYGGNGYEAPYHLRVTRTGTGSSSVFRGYVSANGSSWTEIGDVTINMPTTVWWGLAVTSHNNSLLNTSVFQNYFATEGAPPSGLMGMSSSFGLAPAPQIKLAPSRAVNPFSTSPITLRDDVLGLMQA